MSFSKAPNSERPAWMHACYRCLLKLCFCMNSHKILRECMRAFWKHCALCQRYAMRSRTAVPDAHQPLLRHFKVFRSSTAHTTYTGMMWSHHIAPQPFAKEVWTSLEIERTVGPMLSPLVTGGPLTSPQCAFWHHCLTPFLSQHSHQI